MSAETKFFMFVIWMLYCALVAMSSKGEHGLGRAVLGLLILT